MLCLQGGHEAFEPERLQPRIIQVSSQAYRGAARNFHRSAQADQRRVRRRAGHMRAASSPASTMSRRAVGPRGCAFEPGSTTSPGRTAMLTQAQETPTQLDALRPVKISSELESSKLDVRIDTLNRLAMALDASMAELFDETSGLNRTAQL